MQHDYLFLIVLRKDVQWSEEDIISHAIYSKLWNLNIKVLNEINKNHTNDMNII